jgi:putative peptidoglycan lipid II flippase
MQFRPDLGRNDPRFQKVMVNLGPVIIGSLVLQISVLLDRLIAWWLIPNPGALTVLYMGDRLVEFPLAVIGISLGTVVFPMFSQHVARGELDKLAQAIPQALRISLFLAIPATVGLVTLAFPLISLIYQHRYFTAEAAFRTSYVLIAYSCGLWAYTLLQIIPRAFYAFGDTLTPMRVANACVVANLFAKLILAIFLEEAGLALATSLGAMANVTILLWLLCRKIPLVWQGFVSFLGKTIFCSLAMGAAVVLAQMCYQYPPHLLGRLLKVSIPVLLGISVYFVASQLLKVPEMEYFLRRRKNKSSKDQR